MENLYSGFKWIASYISVLPLLIGIIRIRKLDRAFLFFLSLIIVETGIAFYSTWQYNRGIYNNPSLHLLTFLEVLFAGPFFYLILKKKLLKGIVVIISILFLILTTVNSFFIQDIYDYNQIPRMMEGYIFVVFSFFYFYELINSPQIVKLSNSAEFWAVVALFTYFGTTQFVHLFSDFLMNNHDEIYILMRDINRVMIILYYSFFAIALWKKK